MIDWDYWANLAVVSYADACVLSRGFDPREVKQNALPQELKAELRRRESIAKSHLGRDLPSYETDADSYYGRGQATGVRLAEFHSWAESLPTPFTFPDGFPKEVPSGPAAPVAKKPIQDKPMATKERNSLLRIIRALDVMAELPDRGPASSIVAQLQQLGFNGPSDDTIRKVISEARALEKD